MMNEIETLWLEPVGGISGDMALAALLDLGVDVDAVRAELAKLRVEGWSLQVGRGEKMGIVGTRVEVEVERQAHGRTWAQIQALIEGAGLRPGAARRALGIFEALAVAEAKVHGVAVGDVHFHEVGAVDSIVDVVGVAVALDLLAPGAIRTSPPPMGSGVVHTEHGPMPIPAPATLEVLVGRELRASGPGERTTPTGAAILAAMASGGPPTSWTPRKVGYGVGHKDFDDAANVLRATLGREGGGEGALWVLECNVDDATPQVLAHAMDRCREAGALDTWVAPITMKKGRPGHLLGVLAPSELRDALCAVLVEQTPTLGVRFHPIERFTLERHFEQVQTQWGEVPIKIATRDGVRLDAAPEWEACARLADAHGVPARRVEEEALARWLVGRGGISG